MGRALALAALVLVGCVSKGTFHCATSSECAGNAGAGVCEPNGFCSFADPACASGRRFGARSEPADVCVTGDAADGGPDGSPNDARADGMASPDAAPADAGPDASAACGLANNACCAGASCGGGLRCTAPTGGICTCLASITSRNEHTCIIKTDGSLWCFGNNGYTQLAHNNPPLVGTPVPANLPAAVHQVLSVGVGAVQTCIVDQDHVAWCVGGNYAGQCGDGTLNSHFGDWVTPLSAPMPPAPVPQMTLSEVATLAGGDNQTCALTQFGGVGCWGGNDSSQLGYPTPAAPDDYSPYVGATIASGVSLLSVGAFHACVILAADKSVRCWGLNAEHELGTGAGSPATSSLTPVQAGTLTGVIRLGLGFNHSCAVTDQHEVWCWGSGQYGATGLGSQAERPSPTKLTTLSNVLDVVAGDDYSCALKGDGTVWCWGQNMYGEIGQAPIGGGNFSTLPLEVPGVTDAIDITSGDTHTCIIRRSGKVSCWGSNSNAAIGTDFATLMMSATPIDIRISCP